MNLNPEMLQMVLIISNCFVIASIFTLKTEDGLLARPVPVARPRKRIE